MSDRPTVLVVTDDPDLSLLCRALLAQDGYTVVEDAGATAVPRARELRPEAILLDVPGPGGWGVLDALKDDVELAAIPVILLAPAGSGALEEPRRAWSRGAAEQLTRPFAPLVLSHALQDALATSPADERRRRRLLLDNLALLDP